MKLKTTLLGILVGGILLSQTACSKPTEVNNSLNDGNTKTNESNAEDTTELIDDLEEANNQQNDIDKVDSKIMDEFNILVSSKNVKIIDIITFIESNIAAVSEEDASLMLLRLEEHQVNGRTILEETYYTESIQASFHKAYQEGIDFSKTDELSDATLKELLEETKSNGFKLEQAEGFYFPVIDYSIYQQFVTYVTTDIKEYINIMTVESDQVFAKDAALTITWKEVIDRALSQESFLVNHSESVKAPAILELYQRYELISMFGLNNTPLFEYDSKVFNEEAKLAYDESLNYDLKSDYITKLKGFMDIVKTNNYILTEEVEEYRNEITNNPSTDTKENRYFVAGIDNASEFEETFHLLQELVEQDDKKVVAEYIAYPIKVMINGTRTAITDEASFIENYDSIITEVVKNAFINQKVEDTFVNYQGVMVGQGEIWFNKLEGTKHTYSIYGINN